MPRQWYPDSPFTIDRSMTREDMFEQLVFMLDEDFKQYGEWIDDLIAAWDDAVDARRTEEKSEGN